METDFELLLFRLYTDQAFREAVRRNPLAVRHSYKLSEQEMSALAGFDFDALAAACLSPSSNDTSECRRQ